MSFATPRRDMERDATTETPSVASLREDKAGDPEAAISIRDLSFTFPDRRDPVLRDLSLDVRKGEFLVITGPSGCGKSTLALVMAGYIPQAIEGTLSGNVLVCGARVAETPLCDLSCRISLCQQDPESQLCTLTVEDEVNFGPENLALPVEDVLRRKEEALAAIGSAHLKGRDVRQLSGGEKQRVAIASMLAMRPSVLILDEPTSNLDPEAAEEVIQAIEKIRREQALTLIVIEHKLDRLLAIADRLIVMEDGRIRSDGRPELVFPQYAADMNRLRAIPARPGPETNPREEITLRVNDIHFHYGDREALRGVSFSARKGEFVGVIGANGSGKSTFLACLAGLNRPSSGQVVVNGCDTREVKTSTIARNMGFVFQNPNHQIFENTVTDEISFACRNFGFEPETTGRLTRGLMTEYGLAPYAAFHPLRLSHGEKRRLNLCSVLPHGPSIVILDEPFIGQDDANTALMIAALLHLAVSGHTVLIVSHDMDMVFTYCSRVVLFDQGRIVVDDVPDAARRRIETLGKTSFLPVSPCS